MVGIEMARFWRLIGASLLALIVCLSSAITDPTEPKTQAPFWTHVGKDVARAIPYMKGTLEQRIDQAIAGLRNRYHLNLYLKRDQTQPLIPVQNGQGARFLRLFLFDTTNIEFPNERVSAFYLIRHTKAGWQCEFVKWDDVDERIDYPYTRVYVRPNFARIEKDYLVIAGRTIIVDGLGYGGAEVFKKTSKGWKLTSVKVTHNECVRGADPKSPPGYVTLVTRQYGEHIDSSHMGLHVTWLTTYHIVNGKQRFVSSIPKKNAIFALDCLVGYLLKSQRREIRQYCANDSIAREIWRSRKLIDGDHTPVDGIKPDTEWDENTTLCLSNAKLGFYFAKRTGKWVVVQFKKNVITQ